MEDLKPAVDMIKKFEGCVLTAYKDPVGVWTIGYGHTLFVRSGQHITQMQAEELLKDDVTIFADGVKKMITAPINNNQLCALISFSFNVGLRTLHHSTLLHELNRGADKVTVAEQFLRWTHAGGQVLEGLVKRRKEEAHLFIS